MDILLQEHQQLLTALLSHDVSFILIGGYAVAYHGYERLTGGMDIWLQPTNVNKDNLLKALAAFGIEESDIARVALVDFTQPQFFYIGKAPRKIDFLTFIKTVAFEPALAQANHFVMTGHKIPVIHYHHLIISKTNTGRLKDEADIEELKRINRYKEK
jgi:predicted nucleotidyltransferase